ncbi:SDR family NAD(P)-dependent oxidoreductase, partial [Salmonella enterica subsp. enterica serovar Typhimurium]|nr:SDR family NAD(P)-dependent oxidoreductase [Salmonella enterica subsp. enterica serovar Typhimurium]
LGLRVDTLINNAGFGVHGEFVEADSRRLQQMLDVNVSALTQLARLYGEDMRRRGDGRMLLVASLLGFMASPDYPAYAATKAYVLSLGEALHDELAP